MIFRIYEGENKIWKYCDKLKYRKAVGEGSLAQLICRISEVTTEFMFHPCGFHLTYHFGEERGLFETLKGLFGGGEISSGGMTEEEREEGLLSSESYLSTAFLWGRAWEHVSWVLFISCVVFFNYFSFHILCIPCFPIMILDFIVSINVARY